jgi:hypothetical protein
VSYGGETRDVEFINRHWYWLNWDDQRGENGAYTINPAYNFIIAPKEYGLGTEEDHYCEEGKPPQTKNPKMRKTQDQKTVPQLTMIRPQQQTCQFENSQSHLQSIL